MSNIVDTELGKICSFQNGRAFKKSEWVEVGLPIIRIANLTSRYAAFNRFNGDYDSKILIQNGDIIFSWSGSLKVEIWDRGNALLNQHLYKVGFKADVQKKWVYYLLLYSISYLSKKMTGATLQHVTKKELVATPVSLPDIATQNEIVSKLDQAFEAIDQAIANTEKNIENVDELLKSSINALISNVSSNSIEMNLNDLTTKIGSGATPKGGKSSYKLEGISLIRSMNVHDLRFKKKDLAFIDEYQADNLKNVTLEIGDVLLNITGASISRTCIVPTEVLSARVNQHVSIIRAKKDLIRPAFLNLMLYSQRYKNEILGIGEKGATRQAITKGQLESLNVKFPRSLDEQDILIEKANYLLEKTRVSRILYEKKLNNLIELKMSILEKAFKGELV